ncbi:MAG TPA: hypothetical protein H9717_06995 [Candidatus Eisenbergiella merdipullorum]|uniref:Metallo-beta-lactamase domain-containing protein n=1 Tax=Candidatus Eisenbergiella merdipullorum TaxID=2838553 RepID=A0A9D2KZZ4_9FIRM|nr:hypothetical protein [Candidatus Eisenbergiella merdipullorum]
MKIRYLGTAACEGVPAAFCKCGVCEKSRKAGGRNIRTRSQAVIDDTLLLDLNADTYIHSLYYGLDLPSIHTCLITHDHKDHLYQDELGNRREGFAHGIDGQPLYIYGTYPAYAKVAATIAKGTGEADHNVMEDRVVPVRVKAFVPFETEGYRITPLAARHDERCEPLIYLIEKEGKALLYAHDTGLFPEETWEYLVSHPVKLDLVSLDCTHAVQQESSGHMGFSANAKIRDRLVKEGLADGNTVYVANHFTHNAGVTYDEMLPVAEKYGFLVSYDGMEIEV